MNSEFLFGIGRKLLTLQELERDMDAIITSRVLNDFAFMDRRIVEIYDQRQRNDKNSPPLRSLGKMPVGVVLQKFR